MKCRTFFLVLLLAATFLLGWIAFRSRPLPIASNISSSPNDSPSQPIDNSRPQQPARAITGPAAPPKDSRTAAIADITERRDQQIAEIKRRASGFEIEADRRQIADIRRKAEQQIKALLSDAENRALQVEDFKRTDLGKALAEHLAATPEDSTS